MKKRGVEGLKKEELVKERLQMWLGLARLRMGVMVICHWFVLNPMLMRSENQSTNYCSVRIGLRIESASK